MQMMVRAKGILIAVALAVLLSSASWAAEGWTRFNSSEGRFSVMVPATPKHKSSTNDSPVGKIVEHSYVAEKQGASFTVSVTDLPGAALLFAGRGTLYDKARKALLSSVKGTQVSFQPITVNGRDGRVLDYRLNGSDRLGRAYIFLVGRRLYVADATLPKAKAPKGFEPFFTSLKVTGE